MWITQSNGKKDKADPRKLAELARGNVIPRKVHVAAGVIRELRKLISARNTAMRKRVSLTNCLRRYALQEGGSVDASFLLNPKWPELMLSSKISENLKIIFTTFMPAVDALKDAGEEFHCLCLFFQVTSFANSDGYIVSHERLGECFGLRR
jgi:hypothetical protein